MTARAGQAGTDPHHEAAPPGMARFLPLAIVASAAAAFWLFGLDRYVSIAAIVDHRDDLIAAIAARPLLAALAFVVAYAACVAISLPGASLLTIAGGALFGALAGGALAVVAATTGAAIVSAVARSSFGDGLARRAGPFIARFAAGFERDAFAYLLSLRLAPVFPFWLVNLAPALVGVGFRTQYAVDGDRDHAGHLRLCRGRRRARQRHRQGCRLAPGLSLPPAARLAMRRSTSAPWRRRSSASLCSGSLSSH